MAYDARPSAGKSYRLDPDLAVHVVLEAVTIPNGWVLDTAGGGLLDQCSQRASDRLSTPVDTSGRLPSLGA